MKVRTGFHADTHADDDPAYGAGSSTESRMGYVAYTLLILFLAFVCLFVALVVV